MANLQHPAINPENRPYFEAAAAGKLAIKRCADCGEVHFYPRAVCPNCRSASTEWIDASGRGEIYSFSVVRRATPPFAVAYVTLDEGVSAFTNIVDCDLDTLEIGRRVSVRYREADDGLPMVVFTPD